jgi:hypothetical protein
MDIYSLDIYSHEKNTHLVVVYYNKGKPTLFQIYMDVTLCGLKHQLDQLNGRLNKGDARRVACDSDV